MIIKFPFRITQMSDNTVNIFEGAADDGQRAFELTIHPNILEKIPPEALDKIYSDTFKNLIINSIEVEV